MYEPPVKMVERICEEITRAKEEYVYSQIRAVVDVDKEELLKALRHDRQQYEKGYSDGVAARDAEIVRCKECEHRDGIDGQCPVQSTGDPFYDWEPDDNFFCADGDRREDENV